MTVENELVALATDDGRRLWSQNGIPETAGLLGSSSPAVEGEVVVVGYSSGELYALTVENGRTLWSDNLAATRNSDAVSALADIRGRPVIDRGRVFAVSHSGRMVSIDLRTGERKWEQDIGSVHGPWVAGDYVYILSNNNELLCLTRNEGKVRWVRQLPSYEDEKAKEDPIEWAGPVLGSDRLILLSSTAGRFRSRPIPGRLSAASRCRAAPLSTRSSPTTRSMSSATTASFPPIADRVRLGWSSRGSSDERSWSPSSDARMSASRHCSTGLSAAGPALVDDTPGVTRDRREGAGRIADLEFRAIDTAGLAEAAPASLAGRMQAQTERALAEADVALLVIDARAGVTEADRHFAGWLRRSGKPVVLVANKTEGRATLPGVGEAYRLGLGDPVPISAEHGEGLAELYERLAPFAANLASSGSGCRRPHNRPRTCRRSRCNSPSSAAPMSANRPWSIG